MIRNVKNFIVGFLLIFTLVIVFSSYFKIFASSEKINSYHTDILINKDGSINVKETISYDFGNIQRHGIFRNIPFVKTNSENEKFKLEIKDILVRNDKNEKLTTEITTSGENKNLRIGDPDKTITGVNTYVITYKVLGALTYFSDHDELYWNVTGNDWEVPILKSTIRVNFSEDIKNSLNSSQNELNAKCFTGIYGSKDEECFIDKTKSDAFFTTIRPLNPSEGISIVLGFEKGLVDILEPQKYGPPDWLVNMILFVLTILTITWYLVVPVLRILRLFKFKNNLNEKKRILSAWFSPPKDTIGNEYTPAETGFLLNYYQNSKYISSTIIHLAQKGYLKINATNPKDISFIKLKEDSDLETFEKTLFNGIFGNTTLFSNSNISEVKLKSLKSNTKFIQAIGTFSKDLEALIDKKNIFEKKFSHYRNINVLFTVLGSFTFNIIMVLIEIILGRKYFSMTDNGIDKYSESLSLKNFLVSQNDQLDFQATNQMFFEKLLPYATAFGVEDVWIKRFGNLNLQEVSWYEGSLNNALVYSTLTRNLNSGISKAYAYSHSSSSSGFSSGLSGGGFSGGGGGGGGGGSW